MTSHCLPVARAPVVGVSATRGAGWSRGAAGAAHRRRWTVYSEVRGRAGRTSQTSVPFIGFVHLLQLFSVYPRSDVSAPGRFCVALGGVGGEPCSQEPNGAGGSSGAYQQR